MWKCSKCAEEVEELFDVCWNCGTTPDGVEDPNFDKHKRGQPLLPDQDLESVVAHEAEQRSAMERAWTGEKRRPCPDCGTPLGKIRLSDGSSNDAGGRDNAVCYAAEADDRGWFRGAVPALGQIAGLACPDCGRVLLFAVPSKS